MNIHIYPHPILRTGSSIPIDIISVKIQTLIEDMAELMYENNGMGLAANQVGVPARVIIFDMDKEGFTAIINPVIISSGGEFISEEGCLSLPGFSGKIKRKQFIHVEGIDRYSKPITIEAEDLLAACIQHEIDHLNGILLIDKVSRLKKETYIRKLRKYHKKAK